MACTECSGTEHDIEFCPKAEWYYGGTNGACEHWALQHDRDGQALSVKLDNGDIDLEEYYYTLVMLVSELHAVSECGLPVR